MAKASPQDIMGHPDGNANITPPYKTVDPAYKPALGNIAAQLTGPASSRSDSPDVETLDGQFQTNTDKNLY